MRVLGNEILLFRPGGLLSLRGIATLCSAGQKVKNLGFISIEFGVSLLEAAGGRFAWHGFCAKTSQLENRKHLFGEQFKQMGCLGIVQGKSTLGHGPY